MRPVAVIIGGIQAALVFSILLRPTKALIVPPYRGSTQNSMGWRAVVRAAQFAHIRSTLINRSTPQLTYRTAPQPVGGGIPTAELEEYCRDKHDASAGCDLDMIYQMMVQHGAAEDAVSMPSHALHAQAATELASWGPGIEEAVQQLYAGLW